MLLFFFFISITRYVCFGEFRFISVKKHPVPGPSRPRNIAILRSALAHCFLLSHAPIYHDTPRKEKRRQHPTGGPKGI